MKRLAEESQSPQAGQFNSYGIGHAFNQANILAWSQSPQAGQFNSYDKRVKVEELNLDSVSIPSSGSIQFLPFILMFYLINCLSLNPLKRVNSILTLT